jgi:hypothetical protein
LNLRWKRKRVEAIVCASSSEANDTAKAKEKATTKEKAPTAKAYPKREREEKSRMPDAVPEKGLHYRDAETDRLHSIPRISGPVSFTVHEGVQGRQFYVFGDKHFSKTGVCGARSMTFSRRLTAKTTCL